MTNKEIAERIIDITCKSRVFCELYPDVCQKEKCDIYLVINTFLNTPDTDTPSRQRGEWVEEFDGFYNEYRCSVCGAMALTKDGTMHDQVCTDFCPNCGARMTPYKGGEDE